MRSGLIDLLDLPADRGRLHALAEIDAVDEVGLERGLNLMGLRPNKESWGAYLYWHALIVGVVLLAAGTIFFVAANWNALLPMARLGIVGGAMVLATLVGGFLGDSLAGRSASLLGGLLFGPVLAVYSQIYQTGADPWELFGMWTVVMVAYATVTRFSGSWVVALVLFHIFGFAWIDQELGADFLEGLGAQAVAGIAAVDAAVVILAERLHREGQPRVVPRVGAYFGLMTVLPFGLALAIGELEVGGGLAVLVLAASLTAIWWVYRWRRPDVVILAAFAGVVTAMVSSAIGRVLFEDLNMELFGVAFLGALICAQVWVLTRWLLNWKQEAQRASAGLAEKGGAA